MGFTSTSSLLGPERQRVQGEVRSQLRRWVRVRSGEKEASEMNQTFEVGRGGYVERQACGPND